MTDSEIVKALKELFEVMLYDGDLQRASTINHTIDHINRQKAEIERYKAALPDLEYQDDDFCGVLCDFAEDIINRQKEEVERLSKEVDRLSQLVICKVSVEDVEKHLKEVVGDGV